MTVFHQQCYCWKQLVVPAAWRTAEKVPGHGCALYRVMFQDILSGHGFFLSVDRCKNEVADHQCLADFRGVTVGVETPMCSNWALMTC